MDGIRLRSDSTGSAKSAFYQGKILSPANADAATNQQNDYGAANRQRRSGKRNECRRRAKPTGRPPMVVDITKAVDSLTATKENFFDKLGETSDQAAGSKLVKSRSIRYATLLDDSSKKAEGESWIGHSSLHFSTVSKATLLGTTFLDEVPSGDEAELQGFQLDLGSTPASSPARSPCSTPPQPSIDTSPLSLRSIRLRSQKRSLPSGVLPQYTSQSPTVSPTRSPSISINGSRHSVHNQRISIATTARFREAAPPGPLLPSAAFPTQQSSSYPDQQTHNELGANSSTTIPFPDAATSAFRRKPRMSSTTVETSMNPTGGKVIGDVDETDEESSFRDRWMEYVDPSNWLLADVKNDGDGNPYFDDSAGWTVAGLCRVLLYNPIYPEFTSLQQFSWAVVLGVSMGVLTAVWKALIELCVEIVWKIVPETLLEWGVFTNSNGSLPLYNYMWIVPAIFGGVLSYIFAALPRKIPGQNDWIHNLHSRGVQEFDTFGLLFILSTAGMASGLSLGPELPLILTSGMIGSWLGILCKQSILSARVLNMTAASAAIGGFFGFPMAGALFVLEVPHRMGLQYFEALSPATIASIVAVLTNRLVTGNDVTGYYEYPFLNESLPSSIFHDAIVFGLFGGGLGIVYTKVVLLLKKLVHNFLHSEDQEHRNQEAGNSAEISPLLGEMKGARPKRTSSHQAAHSLKSSTFSCTIAHEPTRAGMVGAITGAVVGVICMFVPHVMFWGESQLQNLIDKGRTPLPVFGEGNEELVSLGYCLVDRGNEKDTMLGFSLGCSAAIAIAKVIATGLSLGTGIIGGHFWAPLFVGCAASHFLTDLVSAFSSHVGISLSLSTYPCVALLCIMGSCHVVTFRAHMAIILILTLTIDAFDPEDGVGGAFKVAGDYSAVFPLLTVAVFVALQISRQTVFYEKQRSRGDIMALPEVLCEPGKEGRPLVMDYDGNIHELDESDYEYESESDEDSLVIRKNYRTIDAGATQGDIEAQFYSQNQRAEDNSVARDSCHSGTDGSTARSSGSLPPRPQDNASRRSPPGIAHTTKNPMIRTLDDLLLNGPIESSFKFPATSLSSLDDFLTGPLPVNEPRESNRTHRRTRSEPLDEEKTKNRTSAFWGSQKTSRDMGNASKSLVGRAPGPAVVLKRVNSFGQVNQEHPSLLDQARKRAASFASAESRVARKANRGL